MERINVTKSILPDREKFDRYVDRIFASGWLTNRGALVQELEERLAAYLGVKNLLLVGNGTLALQVAYKILNLSGEVITTPFTFIATASTIAWSGLDVVFADIDPQTFNIDPHKIEAAVTPRTSAIVPVHVFGNPCAVERIQEIAEKHHLKVIYDAAHAFGVNYKGRSILEQGDASTISFHATKVFHTIEGGAIVFKNSSLCEQARQAINFGITGPETIERLGINTRMNEFQAAMGLSLLDELDEARKKRKALFDLYNALLGERFQRPRWSEDATKNYHYYPILMDDEEQLKRAERALHDRNIYPRRYFYPSLDELDFLSARSDAMEESRDVSHRVLCLPFYHALAEAKCKEICDILLSEAGVKPLICIK
ncbi:MAG: DegT/DnrJ/EryC1/StrS family aminotransferase [Anaerolineales bacterium]|nr:DegT/DnrJ/EryC1/StrS family aminotransferase [Anaerolineales bacterium]